VILRTIFVFVGDAAAPNKDFSAAWDADAELDADDWQSRR